jgi:hypothetical protein
MTVGLDIATSQVDNIHNISRRVCEAECGNKILNLELTQEDGESACERREFMDIKQWWK